MTRYRPSRYTRSNNKDPKEDLIKFLEKHVNFLQREKRRVEKFFKDNGIIGEELEAKLVVLRKIIDERNQNTRLIAQYQITQTIGSSIIRKLFIEKGTFKDKVCQLQLDNAELKSQLVGLQQDLHYESHLNNRRIESLENQINILESREEIFRGELEGRGYRTAPRLRREDAFLIENEMQIDME
ncbi:33163_t:CDS:2 [Gigaspora margarita]|uniref:33163_t:CDS:1 n=1 Tax=Gigaspora margarita TaxID=4874 RepID=A0ABN7VBB0_GIGMA|nr:33163_t:CDS:2 [Gigaspora margarita]